MTLNCENSVTVRPGNRSPRWDRIKLDIETKFSAFRPLMPGICMKRGRLLGIFTMAISLLLPNASDPLNLTTKLSVLLATCGKGCEGSSDIGMTKGLTSFWK